METTKLLKELQSIQIWALEHKVYSFQIDCHVWRLEDEGEGDEGLIRDYGDTHETFIYVTIFRKGDDTDEDHFRCTFGPCDCEQTFFRNINNIKAHIGCTI